jgi:phosphoglycolate phosphatase-like HAD superfamily hydrolase
MKQSPLAFLFDVDNTLLDSDRIIDDLKKHLVSAFGRENQEHYWKIFEALQKELGYADYLGALQRYRCEKPRDPHFLKLSLFLLDYPFRDRLFPHALEVIERAATWGTTAIVSNGDVVFQPRKIERAGLFKAFDGRVLVYIHKERDLVDVEQHFPADRYVVLDDKPRVLAAAKKTWKDRVSTVFVRQGHYAHDAKEVNSNPPADRTIETIGEFLKYDRADF